MIIHQPLRQVFRVLCVFLFSYALSAQAWQTGTDIPEKSQWHGTAGGIFNPNLISNGRLFYIAAIPEVKPIPWQIHTGQAAFFNIYLPPGVSQVSMGINAAALAASQSVMFKDYGERTCNDETELPPTPSMVDFTDSEGHHITPATWQVLTGASNVSHKRAADSEFNQWGSCVLFGFFNRDNLYGSGVQLDEVAFTYHIDDEAIFSDWANNGGLVNTVLTEAELIAKETTVLATANNNAIKTAQALPDPEWVDGVNIPPRIQWTGKSGGVFNPDLLSSGRLFYIAAVPGSSPIRWTIMRNEAAYLHIFVPPGAKQINMGINAAALAGSQSIMFKDYGETACADTPTLPPVPVRTDFLDANGNKITPTGWKVLTGASNVFHARDENSAFFNTGSCLIFAFFNRENLYSKGFQLDEVAFTYMISNETVFRLWANSDAGVTTPGPVVDTSVPEVTDEQPKPTTSLPEETKETPTTTSDDASTKLHPCGGASFCIKNGVLILPVVDLGKGNYQNVTLKIKTDNSSGNESLVLQTLNGTTSP